MEKYAVFLDLDGTLLNSRKELTRRTYDALKLAWERGAYIVPASGRLYAGMPEEIRALPFVRYTVDVNGAEVYDSTERRVLRAEEIPTERALEIYALFDGYDGIYDCYAGGEAYMPREMYEKVADYIFDPNYIKIVRELRKPTDDFKGFVARSFASVQKVQIFFRSMTERAGALRTLPELLPDCAVTSSVSNNIEINSARANKGDAVKFLCGYLGVPIKNAIAFGDGTNDIAMLKIAGMGVAMGNATDSVKAAADCVAATCDEEGVAEFLERLFS